MKRAVVTSEVRRRFHRARLIVYSVLAISYMLVFFHRVAPGAVAVDLMRSFEASGAALGSLAAMYFYVYAAMQIPAGVLADTLGVRLVATVGALVAGIGSILFALAPDLSVAFIGRFFVGLGVSVVFVGLMRANAEWWSERRYGFISGLTVFLGNVGAVSAAAPLAALLVFVSWRSVFLSIGILSVLMAFCTYVLVRDKPEKMGFPSLRQLEGRAAYAPRSRHWWHDLVEVLRNRYIWPGFFASLGLGGGLLALVGLWGVPLLMDIHGLSRAEASIYTSVTIVVFATGALLLGLFSDHIGRRKPVLVAACLSCFVLWLGFLFLPWGPGWSGLLLFAAIGFCASGFIVTFGAAKEVVPPNVSGIGISVVNTGSFLGAAIVQPLFGFLMDLSWNGTVVNGARVYRAEDYANGLLLCAGFTAMASIASFFLRETYCRNITEPDAKPIAFSAGG